LAHDRSLEDRGRPCPEAAGRPSGDCNADLGRAVAVLRKNSSAARSLRNETVSTPRGKPRAPRTSVEGSRCTIANRACLAPWQPLGHAWPWTRCVLLRAREGCRPRERCRLQTVSKARDDSGGLAGIGDARHRCFLVTSLDQKSRAISKLESSANLVKSRPRNQPSIAAADAR